MEKGKTRSEKWKKTRIVERCQMGFVFQREVVSGDGRRSEHVSEEPLGGPGSLEQRRNDCSFLV